MSCKFSLYLLPLAATFLFSGCDKPLATDPAQPGAAHLAGPYYDVRGQLDSLVRVLAARHAPVQKQVSLRGSTPETVQVNKLNWADELQIFYQADLNKAALRGAYTVAQATEGGATRYEYTRKPGFPNAPVVRLRVLSYPGSHQLRQLDAYVEQHNVLFASTKELHLSCDNAGAGTTYGVRGQQKLILFDTLHFATSARVQ